MSVPIKSLLLDTNIWLDLYFGDRPAGAEAKRLLTLAAKRDISILYALTSTKDVYYLSCAYLKACARKDNGGELTDDQASAAEAAAMAIVADMEVIATGVAMDASDVWVAVKQKGLHRDFEDNLVIAAALRSGADLLVTNDEKLRRHCMVATLSSEDACKLLEEV